MADLKIESIRKNERHCWERKYASLYVICSEYPIKSAKHQIIGPIQHLQSINKLKHFLLPLSLGPFDQSSEHMENYMHIFICDFSSVSVSTFCSRHIVFEKKKKKEANVAVFEKLIHLKHMLL